MGAGTHVRRQLIDGLAADELRGLFQGPGESTRVAVWLTRLIALLLTLVVFCLVGLFGTHVIRPQLLEDPRAGSYAIAFVSNTRTFEAGRPSRRVLPVFLPTTPNPTSGFFLLVPEEDTIPLALSVEEGIKVIVSGGIFMPDQLPARAAGPPPTGEDEG